jgi:hypothetical protein
MTISGALAKIELGLKVQALSTGKTTPWNSWKMASQSCGVS